MSGARTTAAAGTAGATTAGTLAGLRGLALAAGRRRATVVAVSAVGTAVGIGAQVFDVNDGVLLLIGIVVHVRFVGALRRVALVFSGSCCSGGGRCQVRTVGQMRVRVLKMRVLRVMRMRLVMMVVRR